LGWKKEIRKYHNLKMENISVTELVFIIINFLVVSYFFYMAWFKPEKALLNARKNVARGPNWYPGKWLADDGLNDPKKWIKLNRIGITFFEVILLIFLIWVIKFVK
jgi:hypothetical protein